MAKVLKNFTLLFLLIIPGCESKPDFKEDNTLVNMFDVSSLSQNNQTVLQELKSLTTLDTTDLKINSALIELYKKNNFQSILFRNFNDTVKFKKIIREISNSYRHGINPEIFSLSEAIEAFNLASDTNLTNDSRYYHLARSEILSMRNLLLFSQLVLNGLIDSRSIYPDDYNMPYKKSDIKLLTNLILENGIDSLLSKVDNLPDDYRNLQKQMEKFFLIKNVKWQKLPNLKKKIQPSDKIEYLDEIVRRLHILGFIDTSKTKILDYTIYDSVLIEPIKKFQKSHGLRDDGVIGKNTIEKLNISPAEYYELIKINLEKLRWYNFPDTGKYLIVNIPDFHLHAFENSKLKFRIKICVGIKKEWQTPILHSKINEIVLNPEWNVPQSIIKEEIVRNMKKDSMYLEKKKFRAYHGSAELLPKEITIENLKRQKIKLVQAAGNANALGRLKFIFKNPFDIYLHDTPEKSKFNLSMRDISHGCIRVEKPYQLAEFLLENNSPWKIEYVKYETDEKVNDKNIINEYLTLRKKLKKNKSKTTHIKLTNQIPLFVIYQTAFVDDNGNINIREDIYGRDQVLKDRFNLVEQKLILK